MFWETFHDMVFCCQLRIQFKRSSSCQWLPTFVSDNLKKQSFSMNIHFFFKLTVNCNWSIGEKYIPFQSCAIFMNSKGHCLHVFFFLVFLSSSPFSLCFFWCPWKCFHGLMTMWYIVSAAFSLNYLLDSSGQTVFQNTFTYSWLQSR